ncbi:MAG: tyrosine-protein phosphatase [Acidimicrobiales bacterium]
MKLSTFDNVPSRVIELEEVFNLRDLGGYPTGDGRSTRWRQLFRSDALHRITTADLDTLTGLGITTVIDLRSQSEIAFAGQGLLLNSAITFVTTHDGDDDRAQDGTMRSVGPLSHRYLDYLANERLHIAIKRLADSDCYPAIINCFFGKDRTGVLAALLLEILGVDRSIVISDYALSSSRTGALIARLKEDPLYRETLEQTDPSLLAADPSTMSTFLQAVDERYGGAESWARAGGIVSSDLARLRANLLVRSPPNRHHYSITQFEA